jgi:hypothetical protein
LVRQNLEAPSTSGLKGCTTNRMPLMPPASMQARRPWDAPETAIMPVHHGAYKCAEVASPRLGEANLGGAHTPPSKGPAREACDRGTSAPESPESGGTRRFLERGSDTSNCWPSAASTKSNGFKMQAATSGCCTGSRIEVSQVQPARSSSSSRTSAPEATHRDSPPSGPAEVVKGLCSSDDGDSGSFSDEIKHGFKHRDTELSVQPALLSLQSQQDNPSSFRSSQPTTVSNRSSMIQSLQVYPAGPAASSRNPKQPILNSHDAGKAGEQSHAKWNHKLGQPAVLLRPGMMEGMMSPMSPGCTPPR